MNYHIQNPLKESKKILSSIRSGSPRTRNSYETIIRKSIKELYQLKCPINSVYDVNNQHIEKLITYWKSIKLSNGTIGNRLTVLRKYFNLCKHNIDIATNKELGFTRKVVHREHTHLSKDIITQVQHHLTKLLLKLQIYFGLTKNEAIHFKVQPYKVQASQNNYLLVSGNIASNNKTRLCCIYSPEQEETIKELFNELGSFLSLSEKFNHRVISNIYSSELAILECSALTPFRSIFARNRYQYLISKNQFNSKESIKVISDEMGISEKNIIKGWLVNE